MLHALDAALFLLLRVRERGVVARGEVRVEKGELLPLVSSLDAGIFWVVLLKILTINDMRK